MGRVLHIIAHYHHHLMYTTLLKITTSISLTLLYNETHYYCSEADRLIPYIYKRTHLYGSKKKILTFKY